MLSQPVNRIILSCRNPVKQRTDWRDEIGFFFAVPLVHAMQFYKFQSSEHSGGLVRFYGLFYVCYRRDEIEDIWKGFWECNQS